jgi:hypothetical protein
VKGHFSKKGIKEPGPEGVFGGQFSIKNLGDSSQLYNKGDGSQLLSSLSSGNSFAENQIFVFAEYGSLSESLH